MTAAVTAMYVYLGLLAFRVGFDAGWELAG